MDVASTGAAVEVVRHWRNALACQRLVWRTTTGSS
jgi:hypothetical protein